MIFAIISLYGLARLLLWVYHYVFRIAFIKPLNLPERYGKGSWVVVTGGSDGIGLALAKRFARDGFNLCLIARSEQKLEAAKEQLMKINPLIDVMCLQKDFSQCHKAEFFTDIQKQLEELDVSVLVNNVGMMPPKEPLEQTAKELTDTIVVNVCSQVGMSKLLVPRFIKREKRCAQIDVASASTLTPTPAFAAYSASKTVNEVLSRAMTTYVQNVDILTVNPGFVSTNLCPMAPGTGEFFLKTVTADDCAKDTVDCLGIVDQCYGARLHNIQLPCLYALVNLIPRDLRRFVVKLSAEANSIEAWKKLHSE